MTNEEFESKSMELFELLEELNEYIILDAGYELNERASTVSVLGFVEQQALLYLSGPCAKERATRLAKAQAMADRILGCEADKLHRPGEKINNVDEFLESLDNA